MCRRLVVAGAGVGDVTLEQERPERCVVGRDRRSPRAACSVVQAADHPVVLRLFVKRHSDLGRLRNRTACRLHALLCELAAGGISKEITPNKAQRLLDTLTPSTRSTHPP